MNKNLPALLIIVLLLLPPATPLVKAFALNRWEKYGSEGMVAVQIYNTAASVEPEVDVEVKFPTNHPKSCPKCKGTGKVKSGDGIVDVPCPVKYPDNSTGSSPVTEQPVVKEKPYRQVIFFTLGDGQCPGCDEFKRKYGQQLKDEGFGFTDDEYSLIRVVNARERTDLYSKYGATIKYVPQFVAIENGKVVKSLGPYESLTADTVKGLFND